MVDPAAGGKGKSKVNPPSLKLRRTRKQRAKAQRKMQKVDSFPRSPALRSLGDKLGSTWFVVDSSSIAHTWLGEAGKGTERSKGKVQNHSAKCRKSS